MKKIIPILIFVFFASSRPTDATPYIKLGIGSFFSQMFFAHSDSVPSSPIYKEQTVEIISGPSGFAGSAAFGIKCPDNFSFFASGEVFSRDWALLGNMQYSFPGLKSIEPYIFVGIGAEITDVSSVAPGGQVGLGADFPINDDLTWFAETKIYGTFNTWTSGYKERDSLYIPILFGLKVAL